MATFSHFNAGSIIEKDKQSITYRQTSEYGESLATVYPVFPGIEIVEMHLRGERFVPIIHNHMNLLEINHCMEGRSECCMVDGSYYYIGEGDITMNSLHNHSNSIELPLGYMHGIAVMLDLDSDSGLSRLLPEIPISLHGIANRFFVDGESFLIGDRDEVRHIFAGMYTVPLEARRSYYRLKVLELLIYLHYFDPASEKQIKVYAQQQVSIIKQVQKKMISEPGNRLTIEALAKEFNISPTVLKSTFKGVYGISIAAYMKQYRMQKATDLLLHSQLSIAEIAESLGYKSQSKFGAAFKEVMGTPPLEYRKHHAIKTVYT